MKNDSSKETDVTVLKWHSRRRDHYTALGSSLCVSMYLYSHMCIHVFNVFVCVNINAHMGASYKHLCQL